MKRIVSMLRPRVGELRRLAERETDPRFADEFEQFCPGPLLAGLALFGIAILAAISAPIRIVAGFVRGDAR